MKKILSIDGGGIRGIIPAVVLAELERRTSRSICETFDLIAGTSTGGILALGLCVPNAEGGPAYTPEQLLEIYEKRGREIFSRSLWKGVTSIGGIADERYSHKPLEAVLESYFGAATLAQALSCVLISCYDIEAREPFFFKSWRDATSNALMRHVARATSAAPTYFEPARVPADSRLRALIDGGVFVNNPAVSAYAEARRLWPEENELLVVSLGTGELIRPIPYAEARGWGMADWALPILNVVFDGVSDAVDYQLHQLLGKDFQRFQIELAIASDDMDNVSRANIEALKQEAQQLILQESSRIDSLCGRLTGD